MQVLQQFSSNVSLVFLKSEEVLEEELVLAKAKYSSVFHQGADLPKDRQNQFLLGRIAAKRALDESGLDSNFLILPGKNREPLWPPGVKGSISHTSNFAVCVVSKSENILGLGVDLERVDRKLRSGIEKRIFTTREHEFYSKKEVASENTIIVFSIKEAIYKAFFVAFGVKLGFKDVSLIIDSQVSGLIQCISENQKYREEIAQIFAHFQGFSIEDRTFVLGFVEILKS